MINPVRTETEADPGERWPLGPHQRLAPVTCVGLDPVPLVPRLVVAWLQDEVSLPAGDRAPAALRELRWDDWAEDGEV
ncbi:hypothetical protein [Paractinoplanes atraurantiacus]|uniref:Uncharacterized protein n=1 Tax=Paractinoplanes atraurantiacus TaxID=1036182 RepID=A0A285JZJ5_9ACTN|nr:hypothetical protein [Actinoplanes atraurantiacus]SNY64696.1 hypothetical protein SAMN05421748_12722 [Actinoplanes atraurantiacus]